MDDNKFFLDKQDTNRYTNNNEHMLISKGDAIELLKIMKGFERKLQEALSRAAEKQ
jgi:hypothetical protein